MFLQGRWLDGGKLDRLRVESDTNIPNSINDNTVPSTFYTDLNLSYTRGETRTTSNVYANVTNLLDRAPASAPGIIGRAGTTEFNTALYDVVGTLCRRPELQVLGGRPGWAGLGTWLSLPGD